ncbi:hypothetical protein L2E82_14925 [Cichorium intybus]|uniref:Uncharacterized protein n=1 Tax=Cichorium intybus TaxID=13427 RepID=A0ACB9F1Z7_CICIN|nr:hypothetical protein L2E82_14925 [Cichorium intybus]
MGMMFGTEDVDQSINIDLHTMEDVDLNDFSEPTYESEEVNDVTEIVEYDKDEGNDPSIMGRRAQKLSVTWHYFKLI